MDWLWTWGGLAFGYREGDELWTWDGRHVGRFAGREVYDRAGTYLGEIMRDRLIASQLKAGRLHRSFAPAPARPACVRDANRPGYALQARHEDFPAPEALR
jgi:hypothetical protein